MDEEEADKNEQKRKKEIEMKKIGDKSLILSPISRFRIQNPFQKPSSNNPPQWRGATGE